MCAVGDKLGMALFLREEKWGMKKYVSSTPGRFPIEFRIMTWDDERVLLIALILRLNRNDHTTFDAWVNAGDPAGVRVLQALATHDNIDLHFVATDVFRTIRIPNSAKSRAALVLQTSAVRRTWSAEQFAAARSRLMVLYPTASALWWSHPDAERPSAMRASVT